MGRPREFEIQAVVVAAKETFWTRGYAGTTITDLESATGVNRSSLYSVFGSKRGLFLEALNEYTTSFIDVMLAGIEKEGAGLTDITRFFVRLAGLFRQPDFRRGCLLINTMSELGGRDRQITSLGTQFRDRLARAFANSLAGAVRSGEIARSRASQAALLASTVIGTWITARIDPAAAASVCSSVNSEIKSWSLL